MNIVNTAILGLGSNVDPQKNIQLARKCLCEEFNILNESKFVSTLPIGVIDQPDFINGAVLVQTELGYEEFCAQLKTIERQMGRPIDSGKNYGPRIIDIDVLVWNGKVMNQDFYERDFVKNFVLELSPALKY